MGKRKDQEMARALQKQTGLGYALLLSTVRGKIDQLEQGGMLRRDAVDAVARMTLDELGLRPL